MSSGFDSIVEVLKIMKMCCQRKWAVVKEPPELSSTRGRLPPLLAVPGCPEDSFQTESEGFLTAVVLLDVECIGVNFNMLV